MGGGEGVFADDETARNIHKAITAIVSKCRLRVMRFWVSFYENSFKQCEEFVSGVATVQSSNARLRKMVSGSGGQRWKSILRIE